MQFQMGKESKLILTVHFMRELLKMVYRTGRENIYLTTLTKEHGSMEYHMALEPKPAKTEPPMKECGFMVNEKARENRPNPTSHTT